MANINGFELVEPPHRGGMAMVYQGRKGSFRKAFKLLLPDKAANNAKLSTMFLQEVSFMSRLNHPNIVAFHNAYPYQFSDGRTVTVLEMEWLDGMDLQSYIEKRNGGRGMRPAEVKRIALQVIAGMRHAHGKQILHLDLKPSNLFRTTDGYIKIIDFGIAKVVGDNASIIDGAQNKTMMTTTGQTTFKGTLPFAPTEQQIGAKLTFATDVFSFGWTLHYLLTGTNDPAVTVSDPLFSAIIDKCTQQNPNKRYQNFKEIEDALNGPSTATQVRCGNAACRRMLEATFKVCPYCGTPVAKPEAPKTSSPGVVTCRHCGKLTDKRYRFCTNCGMSLTQQPGTVLCPHCHKQTDKRYRFCINCGKTLVSAPADPPRPSKSVVTCSKCGQKTWLRSDGKTRFCIHCGNKLNI